jgi:hypothetical protein
VLVIFGPGCGTFVKATVFMLCGIPHGVDAASHG